MTNTPTSAGRPRRPANVPLPERLKHLPLDPRGYPVIVTVTQQPGEVDFGAISEKRKLVVATYDLCAVCGHPFADELRWQVHSGTDNEDQEDLVVPALMNEAPVHKICALYAAQVCPFVSSPYARLSDDMRRGQRRGAVVELLGFRTTADVKAIASELQPGVHILVFEMGELVETVRLHSAEEARQAYETALETDADVEVDEETSALATQLSTPVAGEDASGVMAGAVYMLGAAFLENIRNVQGMSRFQDRSSAYFQIAVGLAHDPTGFDDLTDPHTVAAIRWLNTRETMPPLLARWREHGRRTTRLASRNEPTTGPPRARPAGNQGAKKRKARRAARRKNRR